MSPGTPWQPRASLATLRHRARLLREIRDFFAHRDVMEVTPPVLGRYTVTAPNIHSIRACAPGVAGGAPLFLQTSPEYAMKRLLAAGSGPIYAITPAFRDGECGRHHNPEFTMLEWYRPGFELGRLMDEVAALVTGFLPHLHCSRISYADAFERALGLNPATAGEDLLAARCVEHGLHGPAGLSRDDMLDLLFSHGVQPGLGPGAVFVDGYPASQAALASLSTDAEPVALRFELFVNGLELANGYQELRDAAEQRRRFDRDRQLRRERGLPDIAVDEALLAALGAGLPPTSGVALGIERLLMVVLALPELGDALAFPFDRL